MSSIRWRAPLLIVLLLSLGLFTRFALGQDGATPDTPGSSPAARATPAPASEPVAGQLYSPLTFPVQIDPTLYTNPFDSSDIELLGIFRPPSGEQLVVPGYWMQPYEDQCQRPCTEEDLKPVGSPTWQVRFTPMQVGTWSYSLQVRDNGTLAQTQSGQFEVSSSNLPGFIRVGANKRYFKYDNGQPYFAIGHNLNWSWNGCACTGTGPSGLYAYNEWLKELSDAGGNYARLFIDAPWFIGLEWNGKPGTYDQAAAARLDEIMSMAEQDGIALQLVLLWHQALMVYNGPPVLIPPTPPRPDTSADWDNNPYNVAQGGPLNGPALFFTDNTAKMLFQRRLNYIVARWGYSPAVFAWEIIDEIDQTTSFDPATSDHWLQDMASYLKQIDQEHHLVTAGSRDWDAALAVNPLMDFTQERFYQRRPIEDATDEVVGAQTMIQRSLDANAIPTLLTDYSLNPWFEPVADDPTGVNFQNTLWAAALSGAAGGAMSDWWDTYIIPRGLQRYYAPLAAFASGVDWPNLDLQPAEAGLLTGNPGDYSAVRISDFNRQFSDTQAQVVTHTITADGVFPELASVPSFIYGQVFNNQWSQAQLYRVTVPVDTYLEVKVRQVSPQAAAHLVVKIDDQPGAEIDLPASSRNVAIRVPLTAGEHRLSLDNSGQDWLELDYVEIGQLLAPARALTLRDSTVGVALSWIQHRDYTWQNVANGVTPQPLQLHYRLDEMPPGRYVAQIWDPSSGAEVGEEALRVDADGVVQFDLPPLTSQMAVRVFFQPEQSTAPVASDTPIPSPQSSVTPMATESPTATEFVAETNTPRP